MGQKVGWRDFKHVGQASWSQTDCWITGNCLSQKEKMSIEQQLHCLVVARGQRAEMAGRLSMVERRQELIEPLIPTKVGRLASLNAQRVLEAGCTFYVHLQRSQVDTQYLMTMKKHVLLSCRTQCQTEVLRLFSICTRLAQLQHRTATSFLGFSRRVPWRMKDEFPGLTGRGHGITRGTRRGG